MSKDEKKYFNRIDFNKRWEESDWETFFRAQDDHRLSLRCREVRRKPISRFRFEGEDEVVAFAPVIREYGMTQAPSVVDELRTPPFAGDERPEEGTYPSVFEDPHVWSEGAPLANLLIYRDACRFAIATAMEIGRHLKRRDAPYKKAHSGEIEALRFHANWIAVNISDGHLTGYTGDRINGNIAKSCRALKHADVCLGLLNRVSRGTRSARIRRDLFAFALQLRNAIRDWIEELRARRDAR